MIVVGDLIYLFPKDREAMFREDWVKPSREILTVVDGKFVTYRPRLTTPYTTGKLKDNKAALLLWFISISSKSLKHDY